MNKVHKAVKDYKIQEIAVAGGVSANSGLRQALIDYGKKHNKTMHIPKFEFTTDNAAMIAITGYYKYLNKEFASQDIVPLARMGM